MTITELLPLILAFAVVVRAMIIATRPPLVPAAPPTDPDEAEEIAAWLRHREHHRRPYGT